MSEWLKFRITGFVTCSLAINGKLRKAEDVFLMSPSPFCGRDTAQPALIHFRWNSRHFHTSLFLKHSDRPFIISLNLDTSLYPTIVLP